MFGSPLGSVPQLVVLCPLSSSDSDWVCLNAIGVVLSKNEQTMELAFSTFIPTAEWSIDTLWLTSTGIRCAVWAT